jgi:ABC-2 type transport system ATP-binding protein
VTVSSVVAAVRAPEDSPSDLLVVRGLQKRYGDRVALAGVSFGVRRGEIFGVLGPNGSGKSTAFAILTGLLPADGGDVVFDRVPQKPGDRRFRSRLVVVFQSPSLDDRLTARENLAMSAALFGVPRTLARRRVEELLAFSELEARAAEPVKRFSGGMRRRLELARALVHAPDLLIMDEPTTGLDEAAFQRTWLRIEDLRRTRGLTVLVTTHRPDEADHCDRLAILDAGRIVACETPSELRARVEGDVITIEADDPAEVARAVEERFSLEARVSEGQVRLELPRAHELVPRLVEAFPPGRLRAVGMRRPTLADAFLRVTGHTLADPTRSEDA